jgi:hypothetical protein
MFNPRDYRASIPLEFASARVFQCVLYFTLFYLFRLNLAPHQRPRCINRHTTWGLCEVYTRSGGLQAPASMRMRRPWVPWPVYPLHQRRAPDPLVIHVTCRASRVQHPPRRYVGSRGESGSAGCCCHGFDGGGFLHCVFSVSPMHWPFQPSRRVAVPFVAVAEMNASCVARWFTSLRDLRLHAIVALARVAPFAHFCALYSWLNHCDLATTGSTISRKTPIANVVGVHPPGRPE